MAQGSTRFEYLEKSIDDYIIGQQNKNTRAKTTTDVKLLIEFLREKHKQRNPEDIEAKESERISLRVVWSEKTAKTLNLQVMFHKNNRKVCQKYWLARLQWFKLKRTLLSKQQKKKVQRQQQQGYSRVLCFTEEISPSISRLVLVFSSSTKTTNL